MKVSMIEEKITQQRTMKDRTGKSVLDGDVRVTQTAELANEILNDIQEQRTGGVRFEDESRYMITLRRKLASASVPDWVGEVKGPPQLFPLKTVDVLTGGKTMIVIDKQNQKRWETTLNYPASEAMMIGNAVWGSDDSDAFMPCLERGNTLFFFDQGVLAAFDIVTGNARWRLPTVGVSSLKFDNEGMMYVVSTSAEQQQIKYREQIDVRKKTVPMIIKVDPRNGKTIWTLKQTGQSCLFSGKYFYAVEASMGGGRRFDKEVPAHTRIYRLHPRDGRVIWDHVEKQFPIDLDFRDNQILALFPNEVKVLKFLAL
jgi:outer membrane protein assembly factor BamB